MIVGIIGGIGAGKSTVTRMLSELGADTVEADSLAHEALEIPRVKRAIAERLGEDSMDRDGKVDRKALAQVVFSSPEKLKLLEELVHPEVLRRIEERVSRHSSKRAEGRILVLDVPLLLETPLADLCDEIIYVDARELEKTARVAARGWDRGEIERRERLQSPAEVKKGRASVVLDNSGPLEETRRRVKALYESWSANARKRERA